MDRMKSIGAGLALAAALLGFIAVNGSRERKPDAPGSAGDRAAATKQISKDIEAYQQQYQDLRRICVGMAGTWDFATNTCKKSGSIIRTP